MKVIGWPGAAFGRSLARELGCEYSELFVHRFPDGECLARIDTAVAGERVVLAASLDHADARSLPLMFAADALRELGAAHVCLAAPYLAYMRQDARFHPGEAITSRTFARLLSSCVDSLVTVDPHLHRWTNLSQIYSIPAHVVPAAPALAQWLQANIASPLVVGPDAESEQWAAELAQLAGVPHIVMRKTRRGDREVGVEMNDKGPWPGRTPVIVDDIISTGHTLMAAARVLCAAGLPAPVAAGVHALFDDAALVQMRAAGIARVVTCDTVEHPTNSITLLPALADAVREQVSP